MTMPATCPRPEAPNWRQVCSFHLHPIQRDGCGGLFLPHDSHDSRDSCLSTESHTERSAL